MLLVENSVLRTADYYCHQSRVNSWVNNYVVQRRIITAATTRHTFKFTSSYTEHWFISALVKVIGCLTSELRRHYSKLCSNVGPRSKSHKSPVTRYPNYDWMPDQPNQRRRHSNTIMCIPMQCSVQTMAIVISADGICCFCKCNHC